MVTTAKPHDANTLYVLQTVPGLGKILSLVLLYEMHDIARFRGAKISCPIAAWSNVPRNQPGSAMAPPARKSAMRISSGRFLKRRSCSSAIILRVKNIWSA